MRHDTAELIGAAALDGLPSAVEAAGVLVVFVTARPPRWLDDMAEVVGKHGVAICANGAMVYDVAHRRVLSSSPLGVDAVAAVVDALRGRLPGTVFACERDTGFAKEPEFVERHAVPPGALTGPVETLLDPLPCKLLARNERLEPAAFIALARDIVGELAEIHVSGATGLLEISARGVTKAAALADWCETNDVEAADVWAFGDMPNDVPMLTWAGTSFAVANAHPDVVAVASCVCGSNDEDGVAGVLELALDRRSAPRNG